MKYALFALCLRLNIRAAGQVPLDSIYRDGAEWTQFYDYKYSAGSSLSNKGTMGYTLTIAGDTTIDTTTYKKLYYANKGGYYKLSQENFTRYVSPSQARYIGRLRLDSAKVYYTSEIQDWPPFYPYGVESLMYDFDLNIGDSVGFRIVTGIDSVQFKDGKYAKKFILDSFNHQFVIEGLGGDYGLMSIYQAAPAMYQGNPVSYGLCFNSGSIFYHYKPSCPGVDWYLLEKCFDMDALTIPHNTKTEDLTIYPNPSQSHFTLTGGCQANEARVSIVNILGMVVYTVVIPVHNNYLNYTFNIDNQPDGIYRLLIYTGEMQKTIPLIKD